MFFQYSELTFFEREVYIVEDKIVNKDSPFLCMYWNPKDGTSWNPGGGPPSGNPPMHIKWIQQTEIIIHYFLIKVRIYVCFYYCLEFLYIPLFLFPWIVQWWITMFMNLVCEFFCSVLLAIDSFALRRTKNHGLCCNRRSWRTNILHPWHRQTACCHFFCSIWLQLVQQLVWCLALQWKSQSSYSLWEELYYDNPFKRDINIWNYRYLQGSVLWVRCAMSNMGQAAIEIHIFQ